MRGVARRRQILNAALALFGDKGFDGTSMSELAAVLGISKAGLYHHFRSKQDILRELVDPLLDDVAAIAGDPPEPEGRSVLARRRAILEAYLDAILKHRRTMALLGHDLSVLAKPEVGVRVKVLNERLLELVADPEDGLVGRVRAECALGALRFATIRFSDADVVVVRDASLRAALRLLEDDQG